jgi:hypothetical protein
MTKEQANYLISTVDSRHQSAQPLLRKFVNDRSNVTVDDVDTLVNSDSRYESMRPLLRALAAGEKVSQEDVDNQVDSRNEPIKPLLLALAQGLELRVA